MAAALMRQHAGDAIRVWSAGTAPGAALNPLSEASLEEIGATAEGEFPKPVDPELLRTVTRVIVLGDEAQVEPVPEMAGTIETWHVDEPSERGIEGIERMRLIREDIAARIHRLASELEERPTR